MLSLYLCPAACMTQSAYLLNNLRSVTQLNMNVVCCFNKSCNCFLVWLSTQVLRPAAHELVLAALPAVEELRSTTARMGLLLFQV